MPGRAPHARPARRLSARRRPRLDSALKGFDLLYRLGSATATHAQGRLDRCPRDATPQRRTCGGAPMPTIWPVCAPGSRTMQHFPRDRVSRSPSRSSPASVRPSPGAPPFPPRKVWLAQARESGAGHLPPDRTIRSPARVPAGARAPRSDPRPERPGELAGVDPPPRYHCGNCRWSEHGLLGRGGVTGEWMPSAHVRHLAVDALEASRSRCLHLRVDARHPGVDARRLLPNKKLGADDAMVWGQLSIRGGLPIEH